MNNPKIEINSEHETNLYGRLTIVEYINNTKIKIKFNRTGYITFCTKQKLLAGSVADRYAPQCLYVGDVIKNKVGREFEVVKIYHDEDLPQGKILIRIKFIESGYSCIVNATIVKTGSIKDLLQRSVHDVGYIGVGKYKTQEGRKKVKANTIWAAMIQRCYTDTTKPCYDKSIVESSWHNYQNYAEWFYDNYVEGCVVDKDLKSWGSKVYSKDTCLFISKSDNSKYTKQNYNFPTGTNVLELSSEEREKYKIN